MRPLVPTKVVASGEANPTDVALKRLFAARLARENVLLQFVIGAERTSTQFALVW